MSDSYSLDQVAVRMVKMPPLMSKEPMNSPKAAIRIMNDTLKEFDREALVVVNLQSDLKPINMNFVSLGTLNSSVAHPREILKTSILSNAASIMLFHNHPSGSLNPSREDVELTDRLQQACQVIGIPILDHIIIGRDDRYYSFHEKGILKIPELEVAHDIDSFHWEGSKVAERKSYFDPKKKKTVKATAKNDSVVKGDTLKINVRCSNRKDAIVKAKAALGTADTKIEGSLDFVGNPYLIAGTNIEIKGVGHFSGKYHITQARHVIDKMSGYKTLCEVVSC